MAGAMLAGLLDWRKEIKILAFLMREMNTKREIVFLPWGMEEIKRN
jgi:hypothetical protein